MATAQFSQPMHALNRLNQHATSPGTGYAELAVSSPGVVVITITSTHFAYPHMDGQAELATSAGSNK